MNRYKRHNITFLLTLAAMFFGQPSFGQDTLATSLIIDTTLSFSLLDSAPHSISFSSSTADFSISHSYSQEDSIFCKEYAGLITAAHNQKNHADYHQLACALWEIGRIAASEKMFLNIMASKDPYYDDSYYHSSDIPGDTSSNPYGYGSYTFNYKNYACRMLTKIKLEKKEFKLAYKYLQLADKKHTVQYNCGTGHMSYRTKIDGLYGLCYQGLGQYDSVINMFLPNYSDYSDGPLINALKKVYTPAEINEQLKIAEQSIVCEIDTFQSSSFITHNYGEKNETTVEQKYTSGTATMSLFGKSVTLPRLHLEDKQIASRELFVMRFKESGFYYVLHDKKKY